MTAMLDSLRPADSARSAETTQHRRPTSKDILAGGYNCQREIPEPVECEFCGRKLYHEALVMGRTVLMFAPFPQRCTCDRAKVKWAEADAEEARQKAEAEKEAAQAKRRAKIERLLGRSGIKKRFQQRTFANFIRDTPERRRCYDTAKTYADSFPQRAECGEGLYIEGTYGTGKTHLAAAIALQLIGCGVPVVCKTSGDLLADIKEAFDSGDATEYEILKAYKTVDLLIVDDLGKEQCTEWSVSTLYSIQELRHQTDDLLQCAAPVGEARDRPECYRLHLLRMRPSRGPRKESRGHSQRGAGADYGHHQQALRLRRTEMARNSVCKTAILFVFGGLVYFGLEVLFRGHSHWTMFVLGGFLFLILGELNEGLLEWDTPLIWQGVLGSAIVTGAELVTGMILNVWLGLGVWDYSGMPFNYKGQICLPFSILWIFVSIAAVVLDDWLRYWLFGEEHPHYTLFRRGESR